MKALKILLMMALMLTLIGLAGCDEDDPVSAVIEYDLHIQNNTDTAYDIFMKTDLDNSGFSPAGHVAANQSTIIHELDIAVRFTVRMSPVGETADEFVHEYFVQTADNDDQYITINP